MPARGIVRPYSPDDREAVREICRRTAYRNRGSEFVFEDGELFADYWTRYYTDFEPESCLVVEEDGEIVGYLVGSANSRRYDRIMRWRIVPKVLGTAAWRLLLGRYHQPSTRRMLAWFVVHGWREMPPIPLDRFPAHFHCNLLPGGRRKSYYTTLARAFFDSLESRGIKAIHGQMEEPVSGGFMSRSILGTAKRLAVRPEFYCERPSSFRRIVLGIDEPTVIRAWGTSLDFGRAWLTDLAQRYRL